jgi:gluconokinase
LNAILAIDLGTSSTRARLYEAQTGKPIEGAVSQRSHTPQTTPDGGSTLNADSLVREVAACADEAHEKAPKDCWILGVGLSCFWHSIVGVDADRNAVTPVLLWNDRRSAGHVARLKEQQPELPNQTGCPWHTSFVYGRLTWLREAQPDLFAKCQQFLTPAAYILRKLVGATGESTSMASASGLWDQTKQAWLPEWESLLPPICDAPVSAQSSPLLPRHLAQLPWFPPVGDGMASNLGCGAVTPERLALMIGTSGAMRVMPPAGKLPTLPPGLWRYQLDSNRCALGGALTNGGSVWAWLEQTLKLSENPTPLPPDSHGLTVLPFLAGERAPLWRDDLTAAILGISTSTTPDALAQAHLEAVAYRFAALRDFLRPVALEAELIGTGAGLLASPHWQQILADVLGETILVSSEEEASSRGAALWARECLGLGTIQDAPLPEILHRITPNPAHAETYATARARHEDLLKTLLPPAPSSQSWEEGKRGEPEGIEIPSSQPSSQDWHPEGTRG